MYKSESLCIDRASKALRLTYPQHIVHQVKLIITPALKFDILTVILLFIVPVFVGCLCTYRSGVSIETRV